MGDSPMIGANGVVTKENHKGFIRRGKPNKQLGTVWLAAAVPENKGFMLLSFRAKPRNLLVVFTVLPCSIDSSALVGMADP